MTLHKSHLLEKLQVQLATLAALLAAYFLLWPLLRPWDPQGPLVFVSLGNVPQLLGLLAAAVAFAAACAALTPTSRTEGALLATLIGLGGLSLHSGKMQDLLWYRQQNLPGLFGQMILELVLLGVIVLAAAGVVHLVRRGIAALSPSWLHREAELPAGGQTTKDGGNPAKAFRTPSVPAAEQRRVQVVQFVLFVAIGLVLGLTLVFLLLRSVQRGQVLFALLASFMVATFIAHQQVPVRCSLTVMAIPLLAGILVYVLAAVGCTGLNSDTWPWMHAPIYAQALPIDWLTAGSGGALLGYWFSARLRDASRHEEQQSN